jgi:hypothetical protein
LKFKQYIEGTLPPPPQPDLAAGIDENIRLLSVLCSEMSKFVARIENLQHILKVNLQKSFEEGMIQQGAEQLEEQVDDTIISGDGDGDSKRSAWEQATNDALLAAGTVDALKQDLVLIVRLTLRISPVFLFSILLKE